jgi:DNA-directed RNA polymerase subunit H (RpoH/RPB5)
MLTLRLPQSLEAEFLSYCKRHGLSKTEAAQTALRKLLMAEKEPLPIPADDPIAKWIGVVKGGPSTDELMRMTRGDDWNRP